MTDSPCAPPPPFDTRGFDPTVSHAALDSALDSALDAAADSALGSTPDSAALVSVLVESAQPPRDAELPSVEELLGKAVAAMGGQERTGQQQMAAAVDSAMRTGHHLAVQAGTGTGKSLAYLVPTLRHAVQTGHTVLVSTATIALQYQLCRRDLPLLADTLAGDLGRRPTFALLKGRNNYLCQHSLAAVQDPDMGEDGTSALIPSTAGRHAQRVHAWAAETDSGDRDDLQPGVPDSVWRTFSTDSQSCLGASHCPFGDECFAEKARRRAYSADIVVTNHAMLAIDATSGVDLLPDHDVVVVDEAHELESRVTTAISATLSTTGLDMLGKRLAHFVEESDTEKFQSTAKELAAVMDTSPVGRWTSLREQQTRSLTLLRSTATELLNTIGPISDGDIVADPTTMTAKKQVIGGLTQVVEVCDRVLSASPTQVTWMTDDERRGREINVAPLSVSDVLRDNLFAESTVVLTSATLQTGGSFATMARQWGLAENDHGTSWQSLDVGSPFSYRKAGIFYVAHDLPKPDRGPTRPDILARMETLIRAAGGRTLVLCTSRRAADEVADYLEGHVPYPVLCQGQDTLSSLIADFAEQEESCLVGTLGLWQGVDVPGSACSLVIIDRIPFPRPDDPLMSARAEFADKEGRNGFISVSAAHAALLLAQGTGRLLRSTSDHGAIAVMDSRLETARYSTFLRASLPDYWTTTNLDEVVGALRRLTAPAE